VHNYSLKCVIFVGKLNTNIGLNTGCKYMNSHNPKKAWKWLKTTARSR